MKNDKLDWSNIRETHPPKQQGAVVAPQPVDTSMSRVARRQAEEQEAQAMALAHRNSRPQPPYKQPKGPSKGSKLVNWLLKHKWKIVVGGIILLVIAIIAMLMPDTSHKDATDIENAINQQYTDQNKVYLSADANSRSVAKIGDKLSAYKGNDKVSLTNEYNTLKAKVAIQTDVNNLFEDNAIAGVSYKQKGISTSTTKSQLSDVKAKVSKLTTDGFKTNANSATADVSSQLSQVASVKHMLSSIKKEVTDLDESTDDDATTGQTTDAYGNPVDNTTTMDGTSNTAKQEKVAGDLAKAKISVKGLKSKGYRDQFNAQIKEIEKINNAVAEAEQKAETDLQDSTDDSNSSVTDPTTDKSTDQTDDTDTNGVDTDTNDTTKSDDSDTNSNDANNGTTTSDGKQLFNDEASAISWATQQSATNHKNWHVYNKGGTKKYYVTFD